MEALTLTEWQHCEVCVGAGLSKLQINLQEGGKSSYIDTVVVVGGSRSERRRIGISRKSWTAFCGREPPWSQLTMPLHRR